MAESVTNRRKKGGADEGVEAPASAERTEREAPRQGSDPVTDARQRMVQDPSDAAARLDLTPTLPLTRTFSVRAATYDSSVQVSRNAGW